MEDKKESIDEWNYGLTDSWAYDTKVVSQMLYPFQIPVMSTWKLYSSTFKHCAWTLFWTLRSDQLNFLVIPACWRKLWLSALSRIPYWPLFHWYSGLNYQNSYSVWNLIVLQISHNFLGMLRSAFKHSFCSNCLVS